MKFLNKRKGDIVALICITVIAFFAHSFLLQAPQQTLIGDAERYNGYQAYVIKYSLEHFGQIALWDQFLSAGMSWISHPGGGQLSPTAWIVIALVKNFYLGSRLIIFLHVLTAAWSLYLLFRILGLHKTTSICMAIAGICNQYINIFIANGWFEELFALTLLPLTAGLLWLAYNKKKFYYAVLAALVMSLNFFMNSYYVFHYNVIALFWIMAMLGVRLIFRYWKERKILQSELLIFIGITIVFWGSTVGLSAAKLLPLLEFRALSSRNEVPLHIVETPGNVMTVMTFTTYMRDFFIPAGHTTFFTQWANKIALGLVLLSFLYVILKRSFLYATWLGLLLLAIWGYFANRVPIDLYSFFYYFLPGFNSNMYPYRFMIIIHFAFIISIALGLNMLIKQRNNIIKSIGFGLGIVFLLSTLFYYKSFNSSLTFPPTLDIQSQLVSNTAKIEKPADLTIPPKITHLASESAETTLARLVHTYKPEGRVYTNSPRLTNDVMLAGEIPLMRHSYNPIVPTYQYNIVSATKTTDKLQSIKNQFKIKSILNGRFELHDISQLEFTGCPELVATTSANVSETCVFLQSRLASVATQSNGIIYYNKNVLPKITTFANAILVIGDNRFNDYSAFIAKQLLFHPELDEHMITILSGSTWDEYDDQKLKQFKAIILVNPPSENKKKLNQLLQQYKKNGGKVIELHSIWKNYESLHERSASLFTDKPAWKYTPTDEKELTKLFQSLTDKTTDKITINKFTPEDVKLTVTTNKHNTVIQYSDTFYPGWKATIDGKQTPVYMADGLVKAIIIPTTGQHTINIFYQPDSYRNGLIISLTTVLILIALTILFLRKQKKKNKTSKKKEIKLVNTLSLTKFTKFIIPLLPLCILGVLCYMYRAIFFAPVTSAGDLPYYWDTYIKELGIPTLWNPHWPTGLGGNQAIILPLKLYIQIWITLFVNILHFPWDLIERISLFFVFFLLALGTSYRLAKSWIGSLIFAANTWILMVFSGGQMGVALGYAITPFVVEFYMKHTQIILSQVHAQPIKKIFSTKVIKSVIWTSIVLATQILFDLRVAYVTLIAVTLYLLLNVQGKNNKEKLKTALSLLTLAIIIPLCIVGLLHSFWILPLAIAGSGNNTLPGLNPTLEQVKFFSFATFPNTLGLLHPNWPENIFGKVGFMRPEFLLLPILAYSSVLFINNMKNDSITRKTIIYFGLLGLLGSFLAKGANEPLGQIYLWLFQHVPGFSLFRDSTKFYILIALAYTYLIPQTINHIAQVFSRGQTEQRSKLLLITGGGFLLYFSFLCFPVLNNQVNGIFKPKNIPAEYKELKNFLSSQKQFSRTLWIPHQPRFGYFSNQHPSLQGEDMFSTLQLQKILTSLNQPRTYQLLQQASVRFIILPSDSEKEIFTKNGKYDSKIYQSTKTQLEKIPWLKERKKFGQTIVFELEGTKDHVWLSGQRGKLSYQASNTSTYTVSVKDVKKGEKIIFAENYDPHWKLVSATGESNSSKYNNLLNSFTLNREGDYTAKIYYQPEELLTLGYWISTFTLLAAIFIGYILRKK